MFIFYFHQPPNEKHSKVRQRLRAKATVVKVIRAETVHQLQTGRGFKSLFVELRASTDQSKPLSMKSLQGCPVSYLSCKFSPLIF